MALGATLQQWMAAHPNQGSISAYHPTLSDRIESGLSGLLSRFGHSQWDANRLASKISNAVQAVTPVGSATAADQSRRDFKQGHYASGLGNALSAVLGVLPDGGATAAKGLGAVLHSIIAPLYHGSPHAFEKFALEKIGTGEGAQAYGHGLYFAENPAVAKEYQNAITRNSDELVRLGQKRGLSDDAARLLAEQFNNGFGGKRFEDWLGMMDRAATNPFNSEKVRSTALELSNKAPEASSAVAAMGAPGHLYEVSLDANPEDFLNWDAPLAEQPQHIQSKFADAAVPGRNADPLLSELIGTGAVPSSYLGLFPKSSGAQAYNTLAAQSSPGVFSQRLNAAGVPGIRYFDQGSRSAGQGTSNYVVFDPSIIDILSRQ